MYPESVLYVKVELHVRNFEKLRNVMVMVNKTFSFMKCLRILRFWLKFKQLQNSDLPPHIVALWSVS